MLHNDAAMASPTMAISEIIVVEGRDDVVNLRRYIEADFIVTKGFQLKPQTLEAIVTAAGQRGVIILTDPDFAGNVIRQRIVTAIEAQVNLAAQEKVTYTPVVKHAYISRKEGTLGDDIGVENASGAALLAALEGAKAIAAKVDQVIHYTEQDMIALGLMGSDTSKALREALGHALRIGYGNGKQFLKRLNAYQIAPERIAAFFEARRGRSDA